MADIRKLETVLWESADALREGSKLTSNQYCMPVLGLIFLRYAYGRFKYADAAIQKNRAARSGRQKPVEPADYRRFGALYLPEKARYEYLVNLPDEADIGKAVNEAMSLIEDAAAQLKGVLPKNYGEFPKALLKELLKIFNHSELDAVGGDVLGQIYEYFLNKFAKNVASDDGVFFTPKSLVKLIVNIIEPTKGILLDPACGSGGMFVQTGDFVGGQGEDPTEKMTFYGQEKVEYNAQLCLMNMAVHGMSGKIRSGNGGNTFYNDAWKLAGKCDYIMANPPFNVDKVKAEDAKKEDRLPFGLPTVNKQEEVSNANYLWISYFYAYLNAAGRAGFVMAASATDSSGKEKDIRRQLIETGAVDVMVSVGNNFFYTKSLPCTLWFLNKAKPEVLRDSVLFLDAREYYTAVDRTQNIWTARQLANLTAIVWLYRGEVEKYKALLASYHEALAKWSGIHEGAPILGQGSFEADQKALGEYKKKQEQAGKEAEAAAKRNEKKKIRTFWEGKIADITEAETLAGDGAWLYGKFGDGEYKDIPGLCRKASLADIKEKDWSLTPGAYVGVPPEEDDGVDFTARMKEIHGELLKLQNESDALMETISANLKSMGL